MKSSHQRPDVLQVPHLDELPITGSEDLLAAHAHGASRRREPEQIKRAGVGTVHRPSPSDEVFVFERDIERELEVGKSRANGAGRPQIAFPTLWLTGHRVVIEEVSVQQLGAHRFVALSPHLEQPAFIHFEKHHRFILRRATPSTSGLHSQNRASLHLVKD
jgi:hypothetical protein